MANLGDYAISLNNALDDFAGLVGNNPVASTGIALGGGALLGAATAGLVASASKRRKKSASKRKTSRKRSTARRKRGSYARTAGKRKDRSHKRIRQTKNGQPYIILASGKARFISKKSARLSRSRKGGRY